MRKILFAALAAITVFFISCANQETSADSQQKKNLESSRAIGKAFESGNTAVIDSLIADDFVDHTERGDIKGKDSLKAMVKWVHDNMKDMKSELVQEAANDDYVFGWYKYTGTSDGSMGMPAGPYDMDAIEVSKFKDGKVVEHWSFMEMIDMMNMMKNSQPPPANMNPADTSKMKGNK